MMGAMRAGLRTWMTLLAGLLLGCSQDTFGTATDAAPDSTSDGTTTDDSSVHASFSRALADRAELPSTPTPSTGRTSRTTPS